MCFFIHLSYTLADAQNPLLVIFYQMSYNHQGQNTLSGCGAVDSALGLGPRGRRFESFHPDHIHKAILPDGIIYLFCYT